MRRADWTVLAGYPAFVAVELWLAWHGFRAPLPWQVGVEVVGWLLIGACQARFCPEGWLRSPLWAGALPVAWTAVVVGPRGWHGLLFALGVAVVAAALVGRVERGVRVGALGGVIAGLLGAVAGRWLILDRAASGGDERQTSVTRSAVARITEELGTWPGAGPAQSSSGASDGPPLVLITVDTLRADAGASMRSYGRMAASGATFGEALSSSSWTVPAVASLLTGVEPAAHGAGIGVDGRLHGLSSAVRTLPEGLHEAGYLTAAFTTNAWLTSPLGFARGFEVWWHGDEAFHHRLALAGFPEGPAARTAEAVVQRAADWVEDAPERGWFLWVHLLDPHLPYAHARDAFSAGLSDERLRSGMRVDDRIVGEVKAAYQVEVEAADAAIGRLLDALEAKGVLRDGVVVLTSDHGEELWEHGGTGHGHQHWREVVQVPLVIAGADVVAGARADVAWLPDVATTLGAAAALELGAGRDLRRVGEAGRIVTTQGNAYFRQQRSAWGLEQHAIWTGESCQRFDLAVDLGELVPQPCLADAVGEAGRAVRPPAGGEAADISREALRALGYIED